MCRCLNLRGIYAVAFVTLPEMVPTSGYMEAGMGFSTEAGSSSCPSLKSTYLDIVQCSSKGYLTCTSHSSSTFQFSSFT